MRSQSLLKPPHSFGKHNDNIVVQHINPDLLSDPVTNGKQKEVFVGRGSFGVVRMQVYRGIKVAVK